MSTSDVESRLLCWSRHSEALAAAIDWRWARGALAKVFVCSLPVVADLKVPAVSLSKERADVIILPWLSDGRILLITETAGGGQRSFALPMLKDHSLADGWKTPVLDALIAYGISTEGSVRPLGVLRVKDQNALVVVIDGCRVTESPQIVAIGVAEITDTLRDRAILCDVTLAALEMLCATQAAHMPPPHRVFTVEKSSDAPPLG
jgi:hypothetical protein